MIEVRPLSLPGLLEIVPQRHGDERGFFCETYSAAELLRHGIDLVFMQDNESLSREPGTLRGLHYQCPPAAQAKLLRVTRGRVFDVVVDLRKASPTRGKWAGLELCAERGNQILVPGGFAHGFVTLEPDTEVQYKVTFPYSREHDRAIWFADPDIGIDWPIPADSVTVSQKDRSAPLLKDQDTGF